MEVHQRGPCIIYSSRYLSLIFCAPQNTPTRAVSIRAQYSYFAKQEPRNGLNRMLIHALVRFDTTQVSVCVSILTQVNFDVSMLFLVRLSLLEFPSNANKKAPKPVKAQMPLQLLVSMKGM
jgi:hypothetical protein